MITALRILLLLLSMLGFLALLAEKFGVRIEFAPAVVCAGFSSVLLLAGYFNLLPFAAGALWLTGIALLLLFGKKAFFHRRRNCAVVLVWEAVLGWFALLMKNAHFVEYDNFSHWATVVKAMLLGNRMPNFMDEIITFQSYPLGSSVFVYYVCRIIGTSDGCQLFAQILMIVSFLTALLVFAEKAKMAAAVLLVPLFTVSSLVMGVSFLSLHVDTLMPLAGVALFCMAATAEGESGVRQAVWAAMPLCIFLVNVKNSGIFFVVVYWVYWLIQNRASLVSRRKTTLLFAGCSVLAPLASMLLWKRHVALVFPAGAATKHSMSLAWFSSALGEKTPADMRGIGLSLLERVFSWQDPSLWILLAATVLLLLVLVQKLLKRESPRVPVLSIAAVWGTWLVYLLSLYGMYLFSMPLKEAVVLASFDKYMSSVNIFILGVAVIQTLRYWAADRIFWSLAVACVCLFPLYPFRENLPRLVIRQDYESTGRCQYQKFLRENRVESGKSYFVYRSEDDSGYLFNLTRYELWSSHVNVTSGEAGLAQYRDLFPRYDYLLVWNQDEHIQNYLREAGLQEYISDKPAAIPMK